MPYTPMDPEPNPPARIVVDVAPWRGEPPAPDPFFEQPGAQPVATLAPLAAAIEQRKQAATAEVDRDLSLRAVAPRLVAAVAAQRASLTALAAKRARFTGTDDDSRAARAFADVERSDVRRELTERLRATAATLMEPLTQAQQRYEALAADPPELRASPLDLTQAVELGQSLQVLTPRFAIPVLVRRLITEPLTSGRYGLAATMLPMLRSLPEREPRYDVPEFHVLIRDVELSLRTKSWYTARRGLVAVERARVLLGMLAVDVAENDGDATGSIGARTGYYGPLGYQPTYDPDGLDAAA